MKKVVLLSILMMLSILASAQVPEFFSYQVIVRDGSSNPLANQSVSLKMIILKGGTSGSEVYTEFHSVTTTGLGLVNLVIGNGTGKVGDISTIDWEADTYFLKVEIDKTGGSSYVEMGTTQLLSVPYAMYSKAAKTADDAVKLTGDQTIGGTKTFSNTVVASNGMNANSNTITNVADPTQAQDAATKAYVDALLARVETLEVLNIGFTDSRDGNHYDAVKIGNQIWMSENLKYLPNVVGPFIVSNTTSYYYVYDYIGTNVTDAKATSNYTTYGVLYNWQAAMNGSTSSTANPSGVQGVCPTGWHLPSDAEWGELTNYLGGSTVAGGKLKEIGTSNWNSPNTGATNESGFTALPGGSLYGSGTFGYVGDYGLWWNATEYSPEDASCRYMLYVDSYVVGSAYGKQMGFSVRCVRD